MAPTDKACPFPPNSDLAGPGVTIAFTLSICLTLILTWVSGLLKWLFTTPTAVDRTSDTDSEEEPGDGVDFLDLLARPPDGGSSTRDTNHRGELPRWLVNLANSFRDKVTSTVGYERGHAWHDLSDTMLLSLSINQMVASFSLWICWLTTYGLKSNDYHVQIAVGMSTASVFSQVHVPFVLRRPSGSGIFMRLALFWLLSALHSVTLFVHQFCGDSSSAGRFFSPFHTFLFVVIQFILLCALLTAYEEHGVSATGRDSCDLSSGTKASPKPEMDVCIVAALMTALVYMSIGLSLFQALDMKYGSYYGVPAECSSNIPKENEWTFGNILAVVMLVALVLPAFDIQDDGSRNASAKGIPPRPAFEQQGTDAMTSLPPSASVDASPSPSAEHSPWVEQTWQSGTLTLPSPLRVEGSPSAEDGRRIAINTIRRQATLEAEAGRGSPEQRDR